MHGHKQLDYIRFGIKGQHSNKQFRVSRQNIHKFCLNILLKKYKPEIEFNNSTQDYILLLFNGSRKLPGQMPDTKYLYIIFIV